MMKLTHCVLPWMLFVEQNSTGTSAPSLGDAALALHELRDDLLWHRRGFQLAGVVRMMPDQHAGLERLDRQRLTLEHLVGHLEARTLETLDPALDRDPVAMGGGDVEFR